MKSDWKETAQSDQPWVIYTYGRTHDKWWPFWTSSRVIGRAKIGLECCVCGVTEVVSLRMPRFGDVAPKTASGYHPERERFLADHAHPDRGHPISWARPMRNMNVFTQGLPLDLLAMRLEADINEPPGVGGVL